MKTSSIVILVVLVVGVLLVGNQTGLFRLSSSGITGPYTGPGGQPATGSAAYCASISGTAPIGSPPTNCFNQPLKLQFYLTDLYAQAPLGASAYSCKIFVNTASGWVPTGDIVAAGAAPTSCTTGLAYNPGVQLIVEVCKDTTPACTTGDYTAQKTVIYCPLPAVTGTGLCGQQGPGAGVVPFSGPCNSVPCTQGFTLPIVLMAGQAYANNSPDQIQLTWQNGTSFTTSNLCALKNGAAQCDLPIASSTGRFAIGMQIITGTSGTAPAAPYGAGFASFTPVDLQNAASPGTVRGQLQAALVLEIKATTGSTMCFPTTSPLVNGAAIAPVIIPNNSATDIYYVYILPDSSLTRSTDSGGNIINQGVIQTPLSYDCSAVYNGAAANRVTLTYNVYTYFSLNYFKQLLGLNPEVPVNSSSGLAGNNVITVGP